MKTEAPSSRTDAMKSFMVHKDNTPNTATHLRRVDTNRDCGTIGLLSLDPLNVHHKLFTVTLDLLADLLSLVVTADHLRQNQQNIKSNFKTTKHNHKVKSLNSTQTQDRWRLTWTSSSLRMGMLRMLYFCFSSFDRGAVINLRRMCEGALKWRLRFLRRDELTCVFNFILDYRSPPQPLIRNPRKSNALATKIHDPGIHQSIQMKPWRSHRKLAKSSRNYLH